MAIRHRGKQLGYRKMEARVRFLGMPSILLDWIVIFQFIIFLKLCRNVSSNHDPQPPSPWWSWLRIRIDVEANLLDLFCIEVYHPVVHNILYPNTFIITINTSLLRFFTSFVNIVSFTSFCRSQASKGIQNMLQLPDCETRRL
jgi:hypothetical protein